MTLSALLHTCLYVNYCLFCSCCGAFFMSCACLLEQCRNCSCRMLRVCSVFYGLSRKGKWLERQNLKQFGVSFLSTLQVQFSCNRRCFLQVIIFFQGLETVPLWGIPWGIVTKAEHRRCYLRWVVDACIQSALLLVFNSSGRTTYNAEGSFTPTEIDI